MWLKLAKRKIVTVFDLNKNQILFQGKSQDIALAMNLSQGNVNTKARTYWNNGKLLFYFSHLEVDEFEFEKTYGKYQGRYIGTLEEIAKQAGVKKSTVIDWKARPFRGVRINAGAKRARFVEKRKSVRLLCTTEEARARSNSRGKKKY